MRLPRGLSLLYIRAGPVREDSWALETREEGDGFALDHCHFFGEGVLAEL